MYYLQGDNTFASRTKLNLLLRKLSPDSNQKKIIRIQSRGFDSVALASWARSSSLFAEKRIYLVEELASFNPNQRKKLLEILGKIKEDIVIWERRQTKPSLGLKKLFPNLQVFNFPQPKVTFKFLESVYPGNQKLFFSLFEKLLSQQPIQLIFFFLKKHCHNLILASAKKNKFPQWQEKKFLDQLRKFPLEKLVPFYKALVNLEYQDRTGRLSVNLEIPLVNLLASL